MRKVSNPKFKSAVEAINAGDWNNDEMTDLLLTLFRHPSYNIWDASNNNGVIIQDTKFVGLRIRKDLRKLFQKTNDEIGLGYHSFQEFVREAVRRRLEQIRLAFYAHDLEEEGIDLQ